MTETSTGKQAEILRPQVLIIGAGPVGVPLAIGLKKRGLDVLLVERSTKIGRHFKGEYLQPAANAFLRELGFTDVFKTSSATKIRELRFRDLDENGEVQSDLLMQYPNGSYALAISHDELLESLWADARELLKENFWTGVTLKSESDDIEKPSFSGGPAIIKPSWVIGCDGRISTVRNWMGGVKAPKTAPVTWFAGEEFIVGAEIHTPAPLSSRYEVIRSFEKGTLSAFSLGDHGQRVYFGATEMAGQLNVDRRREINEIIAQTKKFVKLGEVDEKAPLAAFPAYTSNFSSAARGRYLLAGDACNVTTPYGGQGMTCGLEHARYLIEKFDFETPFTHVQCRKYASEVDRIFARVTLINCALYYLFFARAPFFKATSAHVIDTWEQTPELKHRVVRLFGGLDNDQPGILELMRLWGVGPKAATNILPNLRELMRLSQVRSRIPRAFDRLST